MEVKDKERERVRVRERERERSRERENERRSGRTKKAGCFLTPVANEKLSQSQCPLTRTLRIAHSTASNSRLADKYFAFVPPTHHTTYKT